MAVKPQPAEADLHSCKTCSLPTADPSTSSSDTCTCDKPAFGEALRWILTVAASMAIFLILWYYERKGVTKSEDKRWFNVLIQGALLMLSLNFVPSLKQLAVRGLREDGKIFTKKLLGSQLLSLRVLVTQAGSIGALRFACIFVWVAIGVAANVAIVVLGLAYSHESSDTVQIASNRVVNITSMEDFRPLNADYLHADIFETDELSVNISDFVTTENERWAVAHTYVGISLGTQNPNSSVFNPTKFAVEQSDHNYPNWEYHFRDFNLDSDLPLAFRTTRYISVKPSCKSFPMLQGNNQTLSVRTGPNSTVDISWLDTYEGNGTTWSYPITENQRYPCGSRCARIYAAYFQETAEGKFYNCTVDVSKMQNINPNNPLHRFPDSIASILAASIALETAGHDRTANHSMVLYSEGVVWGNLSGNGASEAANLLGRFVIGGVAVMDISNTKEVGAGDTVGVGVRLVVDWKEVGINLGVIVFLQSILSMLLIGSEWWTHWKNRQSSTNGDGGIIGAEQGER